MYDFSVLERLLQKGLDERCFPSAVCAVGDSSGVKYTKVIGYSRVFDDTAPCLDAVPVVIPDTAVSADIDTLYDLASLSKPTAVAMSALRLLEMGEITLFDTVGRILDDTAFPVPADKRDITVSRLLTHTSGIPAHRRIYDKTDNPADAVKVILDTPLSSAVGTNVEYSCLGFILLGKMLEKVCAKPLDVLARELVFEPLKMTRTGYCPMSGNIAATEFDSDTGKYLCGVVHDENARFIGGVSGNAGVFSDIGDMSRFALMLSNRGTLDGRTFLCERTFEEAVSMRHTAGMNLSRGLGLQLKGDDISPCGDLFAVGSFGHTGYTGTSLYVDRQTGIFSVLLTNRVHFTRRNERLFRFRRIWHNAVLATLMRP